jgi:hypothetical protein
MARTNTYKNMSGSGQVMAGAGTLTGMYVNSTTSGIVKLLDSLTGTSGTVIFNTITPAIGWHDLGSTNCIVGCFASISNTLDVTFFTKFSD